MADPFENYIAVQEYAKAHDLDLAWAGTALYDKRKRLLTADQFEIRQVKARKGLTKVILFSKSITQAEWEADAPHRDRLAAKRQAKHLANETRGQRRKALERDGYRCTVPGCRARATHVDHVSREGPDVLENLRSFCAIHAGTRSTLR